MENINEAVKDIIVNYSDINYRLGDSRARADILRALCIKEFERCENYDWKGLNEVDLPCTTIMEVLGFTIPDDILGVYLQKEIIKSQKAKAKEVDEDA